MAEIQDPDFLSHGVGEHPGRLDGGQDVVQLRPGLGEGLEACTDEVEEELVFGSEWDWMEGVGICYVSECDG